MNDTPNTCVLVIDDEELVRDNIEEILVPRKKEPEDAGFALAASLLFDAPPPLLAPRTSNIPQFTVHKASNGPEGLAMVREALAGQRPYAVIFLDMRMPGWDGLETARQIRQYDKKAEIIFVTAYSDHALDEIIRQAGQNVGYHCKPYANEEIIQLATKAVADYHKLRNLEALIETVASISLKGHQVTTLLRNIFDQLTLHLQTDMVLLGKLRADHTYETLVSSGLVEQTLNLERLLPLLNAMNEKGEDVLQVEELVLMRLDNYALFAVLKKQQQLKTEKLYLLKLYVQNAAKALHNAELHETLLQKEKLSAVGQAMGMVLHDLRTPLNNIKMLTNLLRSGNTEADWLALIDECGQQAGQLFTDFLDFVQGGSLEKKPLDLARLLENCLQQVLPVSGEKRIHIHNEVRGDLMVAGDESKLKRALLNILTNAVEAMDVQQVERPQLVIAASRSRADGMVVLSIEDNGPGIPPALVKTLFDPFVTHHKAGGTGLGLAIVKQCIEAHGGSIEVANRPGACFTIRLPVEEEAYATSPATPASLVARC